MGAGTELRCLAPRIIQVQFNKSTRIVSANTSNLECAGLQQRPRFLMINVKHAKAVLKLISRMRCIPCKGWDLLHVNIMQGKGDATGVKSALLWCPRNYHYKAQLPNCRLSRRVRQNV
eukprot:1161540-Pelagomonas_calceolata.AAC.19